jgi:hypothetical protein
MRPQEQVKFDWNVQQNTKSSNHMTWKRRSNSNKVNDEGSCSTFHRCYVCYNHVLLFIDIYWCYKLLISLQDELLNNHVCWSQHTIRIVYNTRMARNRHSTWYNHKNRICLLSYYVAYRSWVPPNGLCCWCPLFATGKAPKPVSRNGFGTEPIPNGCGCTRGPKGLGCIMVGIRGCCWDIATICTDGGGATWFDMAKGSFVMNGLGAADPYNCCCCLCL